MNNESVFDPKHQIKNLESKIVVALERIAESFRVALWQESKENKLSPIQMQILIFLLFHSNEKCKVSYLAQEFNMTKATVSDAVKALAQKKLISKHTDVGDSRSYEIHLTTEGKEVAQKAANFAQPIAQPLHALSNTQKKVLYTSLLELIHKLQQAGIISVQRMCFQCRFHRVNQGKHFCAFLDQSLQEEELRVDCAEFEVKS